MGGVTTSHFLYLIFKVLGFRDLRIYILVFMSLLLKKLCIFANRLLYRIEELKDRRVDELVASEGNGL